MLLQCMHSMIPIIFRKFIYIKMGCFQISNQSVFRFILRLVIWLSVTYLLPTKYAFLVFKQTSF